MTMMKRRNIIMVIMTSLLLGSCSSEDILSVPNGNGRIRFDVGVSQSQEVAVTPMNGGATRSAEPLFLPTSSIEMHSGDMKMYANCASTADIPMHNIIPETTTRGSIQTADTFYPNFGIVGYFYDSTQSWASVSSSIPPESSMNNLEVTQTSKSWTTDVYWPGGTKKATFFAYAPYDSNVALTSNTDAPKISYTVPSEIANQQDLLIAKSDEDISCDGNSTVALDFKHALSAIKFVKGDTPGYKDIKEIQISGVKNQGTLNMNSQSWENTSGSATYSISTIDENNVCFLMPQSVPSGAKLSVTLTNGGTEHTFEADLKTTTWQAGHQYTYSLSINKVTGTFYFQVTPSTENVSTYGGDVTYTVKSVFDYSTGDKSVKIPWQATYSLDGGSTTMTKSGNGGDPSEVSDASFTISVPPSETTDTHKEELKSRNVKGNSSVPFDLSTEYNGTVNTANCYVITSPGVYKLPLVYGNAVKNGDVNNIAYQSNTFVDHNGCHITKPYIYDSYAPKKATLLWQDAPNLVTKCSLINENKYLKFEVPKENIDQGNAVIAVQDESGTTLWSWHIWVTDHDLSSTIAVKNNTDQTANFMPVPLGWCDGSTGASKEYTVNFSQTTSGRTLNRTISLGASQNATFYQWGRKDPFVGSTGKSSTTKTWYDGSGSPKNTDPVTTPTRSKAESIQHPEKYISGNSTWDTNTTTYDNWNANVTVKPAYATEYNDNKVEKTVYDPSPVGFKMPTTNAFTGFGSGSTVNYEGSWDSGYKFTTGLSSPNPISIYFRANGYRNYSGGSLHVVTRYGYYWASGPYSNTTDGCLLHFYSGYVGPQNRSDRALGFSVRPVSE